MINKPLQFYIDKLKNGEKFSMARWGDGELYCMWGRHGGNSNGCRYSPELREALLKAMVPQHNFIYGLQRVLPHDEARIKKEYPHNEWYDTEIFGEAVAAGKLYPFIEQLKKMVVVVIGNSSIREFMESTFKVKHFIEVPKANAYDFKPEIPLVKDAVYLFSCGMAANAFIYQLHDQVDAWLLDVGHIWDPFTGLMSRCDLLDKTQEDIARNLKPCE